MNYNLNIGRKGENIAKEFLHKKGYQILQQNFHTHWGEIDIIAKKANTVSFFEVKTRVSNIKGKPYEAVDAGKLKRLNRPIQYFLLQNKLKHYKLSLDVISIILKSNLTVENIQHFKNVAYV